MPKISIMVLTKNRAPLLREALESIRQQSLADFEVVVVNDGSTDGTSQAIETFKHLNIKTLKHETSTGIIASRQEALLESAGEYVAVLDDDDEWVDVDKLKKQAEFLDAHPEYSIVGGGIRAELGIKNYELRMRPATDERIRETMLFRNNFFTSTVMFRKDAAIKAGGFISDGTDLAEDYDLWLRMSNIGKMYNFPLVFTCYRLPSYNKDRFKQFLRKQLQLIKKHRSDYPFYFIASIIIRIRLLF